MWHCCNQLHTLFPSSHTLIHPFFSLPRSPLSLLLLISACLPPSLPPSPPLTPSLSCSSLSWATTHQITHTSTSPLHNYIISVYWASATLTSVGYGDVSAHSTREMVFALVVQLVGIMLCGYCQGVIAATLTNVASFR